MMSNTAKVFSVVVGLILSAVLIGGITGFLLLFGVPMLFAAGAFAGAQGLVTVSVLVAAARKWKTLGDD